MNDLSAHELARDLRDLMVAENCSLREACRRRDYPFNAVYHRLRRGGYVYRRTLVYKPRQQEEVA